MKIAYHIPNPDTIYAYRTIYNGFKNAFEDLGHTFIPFTPSNDMASFFEDQQIDIFITSSHFFSRKFINYKLLKKYRDRGLVVFTKIDFWNSPFNSGRINEAMSMKDDIEAVELIKNGLLGDVYFHVVEQGDSRMDGFEKFTGQKYVTIPLAADKTFGSPKGEKKFEAGISFIGTNLPAKRDFFRGYVFPLRQKYDLKLYGQDWTAVERLLSWPQKFGQYFNVPVLKSIQKPKLGLADEGKIYRSSTISINVHEDYQRQFGGDCNERTFKIPLNKGFEITDDVACIRKYFKEGQEIVIAKNKKDWFEKIDYYIQNPEKRLKIIEAGRQRVLKDHTYHNRAQQIIDLCLSK